MIPATVAAGCKAPPRTTAYRDGAAFASWSRARVLAFIESPAGAYVLIVLLQLKVIWDDWKRRDLTIGDTSAYIQNAARWAEGWMVDILWSPLYTAYFGTLLRLTDDAPTATWLHRTIITFAATLLVLAVFRRLMPPLAAWSVAAWWCVLETAFNVRREVHLFAVLSLLLAMFVVLRIHGAWGRALALAILVMATFLVRNEFAVSAVLLAGACGYWELRRLFALRTGRWSFAWRRIGVYALPLVVVLATVVFFYTRSIVQFPELIAHSQPKHTLNICQVYAVGYRDRYADWQLNPWIACPELMQRQFGAPTPTLFAALRSNPPAMLEHFWWNILLAPNGLQVALFNAMSGTITPDYEPVPIDRTIVPILSVLLIVIVAAGVWLVLSRRGQWGRQQLMAGAWGWIVLLSNVVVTLLVIPVERPRPEYIYPLMLLIMAMTGWSLVLLARLLPPGQWRRPVMPIVMLGLLLLVPSYYADPDHVRPRRLVHEYEMLKPYTSLIREPTTVFLKGEYAGQILGYVAMGKSTVLGYDVLGRYNRVQSLESFLADQKVNLFFMNQWAIDQFREVEAAQAFMKDPASVGWRVIGRRDNGPDTWILLQRVGPGADASPFRPTTATAAAPGASAAQAFAQGDVAETQRSDGLLVGSGWQPLEREGQETFRRLSNGAEIVVTAPSGTMQRIAVDLAMQAAPGNRPLAVELFDQTATYGTVPLASAPGRQQAGIAVPIEAGKSMVVRLRVVDPASNAAVDPREVDLRVFAIKWAGS